VRDDAGRLQDILDSIQRIEERIGGGRQRFESDEMLQVWVVHHLQIIGEAARSISQALRVEHFEIPWTNVIAMRNLLVHEYFGVDLEEVWSTAVNDLPLLRPEVEAMLAELS
jgi:uncharacterized protein with HEPN domain